MYISNQCYKAGIFLHWYAISLVALGHMTSQNETVSRYKILREQHCKIFDGEGEQCNVICEC